MSVNVKFKVGIKKNINTSFNVENKEPIRTIFRINAGAAAFSSILGSPYDNTALAAALDLKADKTAVAEQIETVTDNFTTLNGKIEINTQAISDLTQTVADNYNTVNNRIDGVVTSFDGDISNLENAIQDEATARQNADTTLQGNINTLSNTVTSNYNTLDTKIDNTKTAIDDDISDLSDTVSQNYTDLSGQISDLSGTIESYNTATNGRIDTLSQTVSANDTAINNKVDSINTTLTNSINSLSDTVTDNYNALDARTTANTGNIATNAGNITTINSKIPNQASSSNQLADKDFVNSSIATNTANFIGTFNSVAELEAYSGTLTNNDYAFVATTDTAGNTLYDRYKYNADTQEWMFEYELNNSSFTAAQWASINSGIDSNGVAQITLNQSAIGTINTTLATFGNIVTHNVSEFATAAQGTKADTALQPNDNISDLYNDVGYTTNEGTVTSVNGAQPDTNGNVEITIPSITIDRTYDPTSENPQSGIAINGAGFLKNVARHTTDSIGIGTNFTTVNGDECIVIGDWARSTHLEATSNKNIVIGNLAQVFDADNSIAVGYSASVNASNSIQLGTGTNRTANTLQIESYTLLNTSTGLIPDERLSTNIARISNIPDITDMATQTWVQNQNYLTSSALNGYATQQWVQNQNYITATALNGYATENWVTNQNYVNSTTLTNTLANYVLLVDLASVATSGDYDDLINKPTIPTVNDGTLTIQKNGTTIGTFTANQRTNSTINIKADKVLTDNITITKNADDELQTVAVIDNNSGSALKYWTGTKAQYDAITTKSATTLYNITDDTDVTLSLLELLFPVGAVYFGTMATCPLQTLGVGTWQALPPDKVIQIAGTRGSVGTTINEKLPNITGGFKIQGNGGVTWGNSDLINGTGAFRTRLAGHNDNYSPDNTSHGSAARNSSQTDYADFAASRSSSTYQDNAPVQQDAYLLNGWRRIA